MQKRNTFIEKSPLSDRLVAPVVAGSIPVTHPINAQESEVCESAKRTARFQVQRDRYTEGTRALRALFVCVALGYGVMIAVYCAAAWTAWDLNLSATEP
jgi:hypothetical protein